ncbi:hypothetical protein [Calidifontibacter indicus]|uniref:hypothetical protein n=1 Tax=Calidifontibacter indicus TaxID=419650 RepID=UPI001B8759D3|nr:hypothetical protein [Calidifontibacter indicus]
MSAAHGRLVAALEAAGCKVANGGRAAVCPAHPDNAPSLSIGTRKDGNGVVIKCHAGCTVGDVLDVLGLKPADLFDEQTKKAKAEPARLVATYGYVDEHGELLFEKLRYSPKSFRQRAASGAWNLNGVRRVLYRLPDVLDAVKDGRTVYVTEGEKDADALAAAGVTSTCWTEGAWRAGESAKWRPEYTRQLDGANVVIVADLDDPGRHTAATIAGELAPVAASVRIVHAAEGKDAADHLAAGHTVAELVDLIDLIDGSDVSGASGGSHAPMTLTEVHEVFRRWLGQDYDTDALDAVMAAAVVERMGGDPLWLLLVSGSGNAKSETVVALAGAGAMPVSTISSEAALLSATSQKDRAKDATGGLLRELGDRGVLVIKDVTSILSANRDMRDQVLGALREVYDGQWTRSVGADGGRRLNWSGRIAVVGAVTTAWDSAHAVIAKCGDRFVLCRMDSTTGRQAAGRQAIANTGHEVEMRAELSKAVGAVVAGATLDPAPVTEDESRVLLAAADLVTLARTAVEFDRIGNVIDAHAPEMPTRFAKQLAQVLLGAAAIGADRDHALRLAIRCARDSMPPLRLAIIDDLAAHPGSTTAQVRKRLGKPRATVDRQLQALQMLGVVDVDEEETTWAGKEATRWHYTIADGIDPDALQISTANVTSYPYPPSKGGRGADSQGTSTDIFGTDSPAPETSPADGDRFPRFGESVRTQSGIGNQSAADTLIPPANETGETSETTGDRCPRCAGPISGERALLDLDCLDCHNTKKETIR